MLYARQIVVIQATLECHSTDATGLLAIMEYRTVNGM